MGQATTVEAALARATATLAGVGVPEPRANAEWLLAELLATDRGGLFVRRRDGLAADVTARYAEWVELRARRVPLQHVLGHEEFHGLSLLCDGRALVPRPETEGLVAAALELAPPPGARVADLGTGGGCIAIALAVERPDLTIHALDASDEALALARENVARHDVASRVRLHLGDLARPPAAWAGVMDLVLSNPPYVSEAEWESLAPEVRDHDPRRALVAGPTGLEAYAALAPAARALLRPAGHLLVELGFGQAAAVTAIFDRAGFEPRGVRRDLNGIERILVARRPAPPATTGST